MAIHITVPEAVPKIQYVGDGAQTVFFYTFPIFKSGDIEVYLDDLLQATGFTVTGAGSTVSTDRTVTFATPPAVGVTVTLYRAVAVERTTDFQEGGEFRAVTINDELDRLVMMAQQLKEEIGRSVRLPVTSAPADIAIPPPDPGKTLVWDTLGQNLENATPTDGGSLTLPLPVSQGGTQAADAATARTNLGLGTAAVKNAGQAAGDLPTNNDIATVFMPSATVLPYAGAAAPTSSWLLCDGAAVSRATYAILFAIVGTTFGIGDGSTTFNLPDLRGRVAVGKDDMGGTAANRITSGAKPGIDGTALGATGGAQEHTLVKAESAVPDHTHSVDVSTANLAGGTDTSVNIPRDSVGTQSGSFGADAAEAHTNVQPAIILNYIIKT